MQVMLPWATMIAVLAPALAVLPTPAAAGWDDTIAAVHARAAAVREARLAAFDRTDFDHAANGHHPIPPETSPRSQTWTGKGFQLIAAALGVQFHGKNQSAMRKAAELVSNMTDNFQYNGYAPTSESGCVTKALSVYCNGTTRCGAALGQLCDASRAPAGNATAVACLQCVARHVGDPSLASCSDAEVTSFCASPRGTRSSQTEAQCTACANGLKSIEMTCHILHNPVMQLPIYNCDGCSPTAVQGYCATVGSGHAPVTHDECFRTLSANPNQCGFGLPLEESHLVRAFSMFDGGSRWVRELGKTPWPTALQERQREFWLARVQVEQRIYPGASHRVLWALYSSENIDTSIQISVYLAADALCQHPEYASKQMPDGKLLSETLKLWEQWAYDWLKARATGGLFVELGADYWGRTWPNILNLLDLPSSARVRQRARMFVDIAQVEAEQLSVNGVRTGQKSRAKNDAITECMYNSLMPDLYGEAVNISPNNSASWRGRMGELTAGGAMASNVSILAHVLGKAPEGGGAYLVQNRIIGQVNATQVTTCSPARCTGTLRPVGCTCTRGAEAGKGSNGAYLMEAQSDQLHTVWQTPSYGMGAVVFSPNDYFSPNSQQRWVGLIFNDENHTSLGMPHLTGEKWSLVDEDIMIMQRCGSCNYGGDSLVHMYNTSMEMIKSRCSFAMISTNDINGNEAFAAVRSAYGGDNITSTCSGDSCRGAVTELKPHDTWAPLILLTGRATEYGSFANFSDAVCSVKLDVATAHQGGHVALNWKGHMYKFSTNNRTGHYVLPTKDGVSVTISPTWQYKGPHLNSDLLSDTVTLSYTDKYVLQYRFIDGADAIIHQSSLKSDDFDAIITAAHQRAAGNRLARIASWDTWDFTPRAECGECTASFCQNWTLCSFGGLAAAIGTMFSGKNSSAMALSNQFIVNTTLNFKQRGFAPSPVTNCSIVISKLCGGARHGTPHSSPSTCQACAGSHLHELDVAKCTASDVLSFCAASPGPPPTAQSCFDQCLQRTGSTASFASCTWHLPLERSHLIRAWALFDSSSRFVKANGGTLPAWGADAQQALRDFFVAQTQANLWKENETIYLSNVRNMFGSENIDSSQQVTTYLALDVLSNINASLVFADGDSVKTHLDRWESYMYAWIKHKATSGVFSELGSTGYWSRTWPNVFNLADLPTSERVRSRAKMYIDVAMVEAEQSSIAGVRAGSKSRAKKGGFGHSEGITHSFYVSVAPQLYGDNLRHWPANNTLLPPSNRIIENEAGYYVGSNVSILMHLLGKKEPYMMRNRMIGQVDQSNTTTCSDTRCAETLRPTGCVCTKGADDGTSAHYTMMAKSDQLHSLWHTSSYALGGVEFSPNDFFSPNSQQRWTGLIFANVEHTAIGLPHLTGEKWQLVDPDVMISQKCASCNYGGDSVLDIFNLTSRNALTQPCGQNWTVISAVDIHGQQAWAGVAVGWGGVKLVPPSNLSSTPINFQLIPEDTWAPIIIVTGQQKQYGTLANFSSAVCATEPKRGHHPMSWGGNDLDFAWNGRPYCWHANIPDPTTNRTRSPYAMPSDHGDHSHGRNLSLAPSYSGPHMNAALLSDTVTLSYTENYVLQYRFIDGADAIVRVA